MAHYDIKTHKGSFHIRRATLSDVQDIVGLLRDDRLGQNRESAQWATYESAFYDIDGDPRHFLAVVEDEAALIVGTMQLTLIPGLSRGGSTRLQIEAVRIASSTRGTGLGTAMITWAHDYGRAHGASLVQLTTDKSRDDAIRFYTYLGYVASHEGLKLSLER